MGVVVLPWLYESHAIPGLGNRPQALINAQAVDQADVVVAIFDSRLGSDTGVDVSGTAEEIHRAAASGKPVHVYFSGEPIPRNVDLRQLAALRAFQEELQSEGLLGHYQDPADLSGQVELAIEQDIAEQSWGIIRATSRVGAQLRWRHIHEREQIGSNRRGDPTFRTPINQLLVSNDSDVLVENLTFELTSNDANSFQFLPPKDEQVIYPRSELQWQLIAFKPTTLSIKARWTEAGIPRSAQWTVAAH